MYLSHKIATTGFKKYKQKYTNVNTCPISSYGSSTGHPPIQVNNTVLHTITQNSI